MPVSISIALPNCKGSFFALLLFSGFGRAGNGRFGVEVFASGVSGKIVRSFLWRNDERIYIRTESSDVT